MFYERYWEKNKGDHLSDFDLKWPKLKPYIPLEKGARILDFGCGEGQIIGEMKKLNPEALYTGIDVSVTALTIARVKHPNGGFQQIADGGPFPLETDSADFIFTSEVIEHVYDTENAFKELSRVLRPGGKILMTTPFHGLLKNLALVLFGFDRHFNPRGPHVRFFSKKSLFDMFTESGFRILEHGFYGRFYPFPHSIFVFAEKI